MFLKIKAEQNEVSSKSVSKLSEKIESQFESKSTSKLLPDINSKTKSKPPVHPTTKSRNMRNIIFGDSSKAKTVKLVVSYTIHNFIAN